MSQSAKQISQQFLGVKIYTIEVEVMVAQLTLVLTLSLGIGFGIGLQFCRMLTIPPLPPTLSAIQNSRLSDGCKIQLF